MAKQKYYILEVIMKSTSTSVEIHGEKMFSLDQFVFCGK